MKKFWTIKPVLIAGGITLGIVLLNWGVRLQSSRTYSSLINNSQIINAFSRSDKPMIEALVKRHNLAYQRISYGNLQYVSDGFLPSPNVVSYRQMVADDVLLPNIVDSLKSYQPYRFFIKGGIYIAAPICTADCQKEMFIVYARAVL